MTKVKRITSLFVAVVMLVAISCTSIVFAASNTQHTITINYENSGHTYTAYQVFKGDYVDKDGKKVLSNIKWGDGVNSTDLLAALKADETIGSDFADADTAEDVAKILAGYENNGSKIKAFATVAGKYTTTAAGESTEGSLTSGKYPYTITVTGDGYYLVADTGEVSETGERTEYILEVVGDVAVDAKADTITIVKKILADNEKKVDTTNGDIGDTVTFELTSKVPDLSSYTTYVYNAKDTLSKGLAFNENSVTITIGGNKLNAEDYVVTSDKKDNGETKLSIKIKNLVGYNKGAEIVINYTATITKDAIVGTTGNPNEVYLEYSNNPYDDSVNSKTPKDYTITYTTGLELIKVDENGNRLTGAEFTIEGAGDALNIVKIVKEEYVEDENGTYYKLVNGSYTTTAPTEDTNINYATPVVKYKKVTKVTWNDQEGNGEAEVNAVATVGQDGVVRFDGLGAGTYTITETKTPEGYNTIAPITVKIEFVGEEEVANGEVKATWKYTVNGATDDNTIEVVNKSGATLPSTGGIGTTIFYIVGGVLVAGAAAAIVIIVKRVKK